MLCSWDIKAFRTYSCVTQPKHQQKRSVMSGLLAVQLKSVTKLISSAMFTAGTANQLQIKCQWLQRKFRIKPNIKRKHSIVWNLTRPRMPPHVQCLPCWSWYTTVPGDWCPVGFINNQWNRMPKVSMSGVLFRFSRFWGNKNEVHFPGAPCRTGSLQSGLGGCLKNWFHPEDITLAPGPGSTEQ